MLRSKIDVVAKSDCLIVLLKILQKLIVDVEMLALPLGQFATGIWIINILYCYQCHNSCKIR